VIATNLPCFRELADDGVHLVVSADPAALADALARHSAGQLTLSRIPNPGVSWNDTAQRCVELVQRALEPGSTVNA
jgi:hypothetical protein